MSTLTLINVAGWTTEKVLAWIKGLDGPISAHADKFVAAGITGAQLLALTNEDLIEIGVTKVGHQELLLKSLRLLNAMNSGLERETFLSMALQVSCKARNLYNEVKAVSLKAFSGAQPVASHGKSRQLYLKILFGTSEVTAAIKSMCCLCDRIPFDRSEGYTDSRNHMIEFGLKLMSTCTDEDVVNNLEAVMNVCHHICDLCNLLITQSVDPLVIHSPSLELVTVHKKAEEDLGLELRCARGIHAIGNINPGSNACICKRILEGDEVVYVNGHTIVGWSRQNVVAAFQENQKEVTLVLKKRPHHINFMGYQKKPKPYKELPKLNMGPKLRRSYERSKAGLMSSQGSLDSLASLPDLENSADEIASDNDVFNSTDPSPVAILTSADQPVKLRRVTVSGGSPTWHHTSLLAMDLAADIPSAARPKSYFPQSPGLSRSTVRNRRPFTPDPPRPAAISEAEQRLAPSGENVPASSLKRQGQTSVSNNGEPYPAGSSIASTSGIAKTTDEPPAAVTATDVIPIPRVAVSIADGGTTPSIPYQHRVRTATTDSASESSSPLLSPRRNVRHQRMRQASASTRTSMSSSYSASPGGYRPNDSTLSNEVAGFADCGASPQLLSIFRIDSTRRESTSTEQKQQHTGGSVAFHFDSVHVNKQTRLPSSSNLSSGAGGQNRQLSTDRDAQLEAPVGTRKKSLLQRVVGVSRRISCKDLGGGDCQGWLWKKREGSGIRSGRWVKFWFVLHQRNLFFYKDPSDLNARGVIHLVGFTVSPNSESKSKKFAFKAYKSDTTFLFASERQDDMAKWMNKIGLASLPETVPSKQPLTFGPAKSDRSSYDHGAVYYSESDDEGTSSLSLKDSTNLREDLTGLYRQIRLANLDIFGSSFRTKTSTLLRSTAASDVSRESHAYHRLTSLRRTLKDKEHKCDAIDNLFSAGPVTSELLHNFLLSNPSILQTYRLSAEVNEEVDEEVDSSTSCSDAEIIG